MMPDTLWDQRAVTLGPLAGTQDRIAKVLEIEYLASRIGETHGPMLDAGCGDGSTLWALGTGGDVGFDASEKMLAMAADRLCTSPVTLRQHDIRDPFSEKFGRFPIVYTERALINMPTVNDQILAIQNLKAAVEPGGLLICLECCWQPLWILNRYRVLMNLQKIAPPPHTLYVHEWMMRKEGFTLHRFTDTYYFLSRVANAKLAKMMGEEPDYDSPINRLALELPNAPALQCGQVVAWEWRA